MEWLISNRHSCLIVLEVESLGANRTGFWWETSSSLQTVAVSSYPPTRKQMASKLCKGTAHHSTCGVLAIMSLMYLVIYLSVTASWLRAPLGGQWSDSCSWFHNWYSCSPFSVGTASVVSPDPHTNPASLYFLDEKTKAQRTEGKLSVFCLYHSCDFPP